MNELQIFKHPEFGSIRTVEIDGEPWLVGKDVAAALGYEKPTDAVRKHVDLEDRGISEMETPSGVQNMTIINESGVYSLVFSSKLPSAKKFKRWVTSEVLPSIRKHGGYIAGQDSMSREELFAQAVKVAESLIAEKDARLQEEKARSERMMATAAMYAVDLAISERMIHYDNNVENSDMLTTLKETAKLLRVQESDFISWLIRDKYLRRNKAGRLLPCKGRDSNEGLFVVQESYSAEANRTYLKTYVTRRGREVFRFLTTNRAIGTIYPTPKFTTAKG